MDSAWTTGGGHRTLDLRFDLDGCRSATRHGDLDVMGVLFGAAVRAWLGFDLGCCWRRADLLSGVIAICPRCCCNRSIWWTMAGYGASARRRKLPEEDLLPLAADRCLGLPKFHGVIAGSLDGVGCLEVLDRESAAGELIGWPVTEICCRSVDGDESHLAGDGSCSFGSRFASALSAGPLQLGSDLGWRRSAGCGRP
ncbi:hypothetical protein ACLOJK_037637 [Asimina triloba]